MIMWASALGMGVGRFSRPLRGVGVLAMLVAGLDTSRCVESVHEVPPGAGMLRLLVPGVAIGVLIESHCVLHAVEVTCSVISATHELFSEDEGVEC